MQAQIRLLADRYILFVVLPPVVGERRIVKLVSEELARGPQTYTPFRLRDLPRMVLAGTAARLGLRPLSLQIAVRAVFGAESYHAEILVPDELVVRRAVLGRSIEFWNTEADQRTFSREVFAEDNKADRAHLYFSGATSSTREYVPAIETEVSEAGFIDVSMSLKAGVILPAIVIAGVTASMLWTGIVLHWVSVHSAPSSAVSLLVVLPAIFGAYLIPGEHPLVRQLYGPLRAVILISALSGFAAASILALDLSSRTTTLWWVGLALCSTAVFVLTAFSLLGSTRVVRG